MNWFSLPMLLFLGSIVSLMTVIVFIGIEAYDQTAQGRYSECLNDCVNLQCSGPLHSVACDGQMAIESCQQMCSEKTNTTSDYKFDEPKYQACSLNSKNEWCFTTPSQTSCFIQARNCWFEYAIAEDNPALCSAVTNNPSIQGSDTFSEDNSLQKLCVLKIQKLRETRNLTWQERLSPN